MAAEGLECLGVEVEFPAATIDDAILQRFGDAEMVANMEKVFFGEGRNALGHSYAKLIRGPAGRNDLEDVIDLLRQETWTKRAVLTLCGTGDGKVPCINVIQFLIRDRTVHTIYFARGQDAFRKFYADGHCVASMARKVADSLGLPSGTVTGFIGSCHVYHQDLPEIRKLLEATKVELTVPNFIDKPGNRPLQFIDSQRNVRTRPAGESEKASQKHSENAVLRNLSQTHGGPKA
ncbi:MAG TPA: thymidylate synthase [Candidatus Limnocylindrales bacterium]|jgi:thymidylate synthase|nr:thymidylate synthase [Candidatus Limnocylindrales bacterium]